MIPFLVRRLLLTLPVIVGVATVVFSLIHAIPGDPAQAMLGEGAAPADVAQLRTKLGLDRPLVTQYASFLGGLVRGDLGKSLRTNQPVVSVIAERLPATLELAVAASGLALLLGIPAGIISGASATSAVDRATTTAALVGISVPGFWLGPMLAIVFSVKLGWLPVSGRGTAAHLVLPAMTLAAPLVAFLARVTRASLIEELREPYVMAARARGASKRRVVWRHAFRNSLIPIVTILALQLGSVLTGAVIAETIFAWPGVGRLLIQSIGFRDYPVVQGAVLLIAGTYVAINFVTDVVYGWLDPRIRSQRD